jgi:hypothetical protein
MHLITKRMSSLLKIAFAQGISINFLKISNYITWTFSRFVVSKSNKCSNRCNNFKGWIFRHHLSWIINNLVDRGWKIKDKRNWNIFYLMMYTMFYSSTLLSRQWILSSYNSPPKFFCRIYHWKYLLNLKLKRGTKCGAIEYFEWKLLPNIKKYA